MTSHHADAELLEYIEDIIDLEAVAEVRARLAAGTEGRRRVVSRAR